MDANNLDIENDIGGILISHIKNRTFVEAISEIRKPCYIPQLQDNCLEIMPVLMTILQEPYFDVEAQTCLESLLKEISLIAVPKEFILAILEQMERFFTPHNFIMLMNVLIHFVNSKEISEKTKLKKIFDWLIEIIIDKLISFELPQDEVEGKLIANEILYKNLYVNVLERVILLIKKLYFCDTLNDTSINDKQKISNQLLIIFEKSLTYLHLKENSKCYDVALEMVLMFNTIHTNSIVCLEYVEPYDEELETSLTESKMKVRIPQLGLSTYFYVYFCLDFKRIWLPIVYNPLFLYKNCIPLCVYLLKDKTFLGKSKGNEMLNYFLERLSLNIFDVESLEVANHIVIGSSLIDIMLYSEKEKIRENSATIFKSYIRKFEGTARIYLIQHFSKRFEHSGFHSFLIYEFKEVLIKMFAKNQTFNDSEINTTLEMFCSFGDKEKEDLLYWSDKIISALNLLIYLHVRDKKYSAGWKDSWHTIRDSFLEPLVIAVQYWKHQYSIMLKEFEKDSGQGSSESRNNNELHMLNLSLNCLDVIHNSIGRLTSLNV